MISEGKGRLVFYYGHKELFKDVEHMSAFMCRNLYTKEGENISDMYSITEDEEAVLELCLRDTLEKIIPGLLDMIGAAGKPYGYSDTEAGISEITQDPGSENVPGSEDAGKICFINIVGSSATSNSAKISMDNRLKDLIESGVLCHFYSIVTHEVLTPKSAETFAAKLSALPEATLTLRRKVVF